MVGGGGTRGSRCRRVQFAVHALEECVLASRSLRLWGVIFLYLHVLFSWLAFALSENGSVSSG